MKKALIIFAKTPRPGAVKTRLMPALTADEAAELYRRMFLDTVAKLESLAGVDCFIFYGGDAEDITLFQELAPGTEIFPQLGEGLGERMEQAFRLIFARGYGGVAIIGTDSPDLPLAYLEEAFRILQHGEAEPVFGPSEDGGYYLLAMKRLHGELFRNIPWSSGQVLRLSMDRAEKAGLGAALLPLWYDVDTAADLKRLGLVAEQSNAPLTREFIRARSSLLQRT
jgi:uncharacterized protein